MVDRAGTVYVLLPVHDRRSVTEQFVRRLLEQTDHGFHLVLIDDGSTDGTADAVVALLPGTTVLRGTGSWWWAGSLQRGYEWLRQRTLGPDDLVLIANDDTVLGRDAIALGRQLTRSGRLVLPQHHRQVPRPHVEVGVNVSWKRFRFRAVGDPAKVNCFSTRDLFLVARDFVALGGFHPRLLPHYLSDFEFTIRARRRGYELRSDPRLYVSDNEATVVATRRPARSRRRYLSFTLSRRSPDNPVYWTTFLLLACPRRYLIQNVFRAWRYFAVGLSRT